MGELLREDRAADFSTAALNVVPVDAIAIVAKMICSVTGGAQNVETSANKC
tara:strand:- start:234 stop:386 length:153 start_codon:yes stop_codon:yes gene_type:complete